MSATADFDPSPSDLKILQLLADQPLTKPELTARLEVSYTVVRRRVTALERQGRLQQSEDLRRIENGNVAAVFEITPQGEAELQRYDADAFVSGGIDGETIGDFVREIQEHIGFPDSDLKMKHNRIDGAKWKGWSQIRDWVVEHAETVDET